ncbi:MAG TPA: Ig-like domain-containing protein [Gemmatimonadaceae bacterium]|nr:Ig-like domain-containing protein [Gemmatimonadaceae bacterium]
MMRRSYLAAVAVMAVACGGADKTTGLVDYPRHSDPGVLHGSVVSPPYAAQGGRGSALRVQSASSGAVGTVTYVSLLPGTVPEGIDAVITNLRTAETHSVYLLGGGFDPQAIGAVIGDTISIVVHRLDADSVQAFVAVNLITRPRVVRTNPPRGQTDVPVNARITIVFSEPVAPTSLSPTTVTLTDGTTNTAGTVQLVAGSLLAAEFAPSAPLNPSTQYTLDVTTGVTGLSGTALGEAAQIAFTTAGLQSTDARSFSAIATGGSGQTCALTSDGQAYCWGSNKFGELGDGTNIDRHAPVAVLGGIAFNSISVGNSQTCALDRNGLAFCWGANTAGQLGDGGGATNVPRRTAGSLSFSAIVAGDGITCGIATSGDSYCWGLNSPAIGGETVACDSGCYAPIKVAGGHHFTQITRPEWTNTCGLEGTAAYCWGMGGFGMLGVGNAEPDQCPDADQKARMLQGFAAFAGTASCSKVPVRVASNVAFTSIAATTFGTCGLDASGQSYCWGYNSQAQFGDGTTTYHAVPTPAGGDVRFRMLGGGNQRSCALATSGQAYCMGNAWNGVCAVSSTSCNPKLPMLVSGGYEFTVVSSVGAHACALDANGRAYCWGYNSSGSLGNNTTTTSYVPVAVVRGQ